VVGLRVVVAGPLTRTAHHKCLVGVLRVGKTSAEWRQRRGMDTAKAGDGVDHRGAGVATMITGMTLIIEEVSKIGGTIVVWLGAVVTAPPFRRGRMMSTGTE